MNYISIGGLTSRREVSEMSDTYYGKYFDWLCDKINLKPGIYDILIHELYTLDYSWVIELDANRGEDGLILRGEFHDHWSDDSKLSKPCSVLEALISLAMKMNYILDDDDRGDRTRIWFWEMIKNLGLDYYKDSVFKFDDYSRLGEIHDICLRWLNREFDYSGNGSPFPLVNPHEDQRKIHLIAQLNEYILENYLFEDEIL